MTRVVFAPDSFKGSISAADAATALAEGWRHARHGDIPVLRPMADGGEGTLDAFAMAIPGATRNRLTVTGPDGCAVEASWLRLPPTAEAPEGTAVVELASTSGIELLGERRLGADAGTEGFGHAIVAALESGVSRLVLGIGSSASTDGGAGVLTALGARILDGEGRRVAPGSRGLGTVASVDLSSLSQLPPSGVIVLTDVTNPLLGENGSAQVFGPQKGLTVREISEAEAALSRFSRLVAAEAPSADSEAPGAGAAGGTGFGLLAWGARIRPGADDVAALIGLPEAVAAASVVVTGEGAFDMQSAAGKVPTRVAGLAHAAGARAALVAGRIAPGADTSGFAASVSLTERAGSAEAALAEPARWLREAGSALAHLL